MAVKSVNKSGVTWEDTKLITSKVDNRQVFLLGCQEYTNEEGVIIPVLFTARQAFVFVEDNASARDDMWSWADVKNGYKDGSLSGGDFPTAFDDQYIELCNADNEAGVDTVSELNVEVLAEYGITSESDLADITARLKSLESFRIETDMLNQ